ncbi:MAG TPA: NAD(P)H-dependent oxidoreductase subunit E, partial [Bacteroidetes bacterium]|nr:NAD(P)H-dependent oxidoreductase subunit E [Bacteroidota bacterium]
MREDLKIKIQELMARYPKKESALMPALTLVQKAHDNNLTKELVEEVAEIIGVSYSRAYG